jgi:hypothetical protein
MKKENPPDYLFTTWKEKSTFSDTPTLYSYSVGAPTL